MANSIATLDRIVAAFERLQDEICAGLEALDGVAKFPWCPDPLPRNANGKLVKRRLREQLPD